MSEKNISNFWMYVACFYCVMHYSALCGIAIVCLSVMFVSPD